MPGEIVERSKTRRVREGIDIDETTWGQITDTARSVGLSDLNSAG
jgi:LDH2 family malate/lactate/ureidoglycolate dehydrogenase